MTRRERATVDEFRRDARSGGSAAIRLVDAGWEKLLDEAMSAAGERLRIVCPFIKRGVVEHLLRRRSPGRIEVLTRFDLRHFREGVSDLDALALLLERGARIRGVRNLHAKVYQFGRTRAVVTSANLTGAALRSNHEFGFVSDDPEILRRCERYFEDLWGKAEPDLTRGRVREWRRKVARHPVETPRPWADDLGDEGADVGLPDEEGREATSPVSCRAFVKFFGLGSNRVERTWLVRDEVDRAGCHWACAYPRGRRPRQVEDGSVIFMGRLVRKPNDVLIFGRAIGLRHEPGRDDASPSEIARRSWKRRWPHYVRVHDAEFLSGDLSGGVSLHEMMRHLGANVFTSTQRNLRGGSGNVEPRRAYRRRADVELSAEGYRWIADRLDRAMRQRGTLSPAELGSLDWPE